ncbi:MAG TPA: hypothetical protein VKT82_29290 [Ktedonobacterales bacterium]|nr:hypothetical protein [Ktedonobacterales bacterium]
MQNTPPTPEDDEISASDQQNTTSDASRSSSPFSASRATRIRRNGGPRISGAIPGRAPLPGSEPPTPEPAASAATFSSPRVNRPSGPRTYAHLLAGVSYLVPPIAPAVILFRPTSHPFARFHALQSLALFIIATTLSLLLSLFTPTNIILDIFYIILVLAVAALLLLWIAAAIAAFEGFAVGLPVLDRLLPRADGLEEDPNMRSVNPRATLEVAIAAGASVVLLILTVWLPLGGWFGKLSSQNLAALGLNTGLPAWMVVSSLLFSFIFAALGLTTLAVLVLGLRKGKFLPSLASGAAVAGSALTAAGTGLLIADTLQRSLYSKLEQQYQSMVNNTPLPRNTPDTNVFVQTISKGRAALSAIDPTQHSLLIPGAVLLLLGVGVLLFLLSQLYYKK